MDGKCRPTEKAAVSPGRLDRTKALCRFAAWAWHRP